MLLKEIVEGKRYAFYKDAALFFTLAAVDEEEHLKNMRQLFLILSDEELLEKLAQANTAEELLELDQLLS